jgi:galactoside O-acetyltransferase
MDETRLHDGSLYRTIDPELGKVQMACLDKLYEFNQLRPSQLAQRTALLQDMFAEIGEHCYIESPLHADWGGKFVHFGKHVYANFGLTLVDDTHIYVGDNVQFGPNVVLATAGHPLAPALRPLAYQYNAPIHIGANAWLGAGVIVLPGITIGANSIIGAGAVVTKDVPANSVAVGNPCHVLRQVNAHDQEYYFKNHRIDWAQVESESGLTKPAD